MSGGARVRIAPSILTADFGRLAEAVRAAERGGADLMHLDVMDGRFVPEITFGAPVVEAVCRASALPVEVHMMVAEPGAQMASLARAGAQALLFHVEATDEPERLLAEARALGCAGGVAVSPDTGIEAVRPLLASADEVVVMLVHPGRGGQRMLVEHLAKVRRLRQWVDEQGLDVQIEVDGGVKTGNAADCVAAGAHLLVAGSAVYNDEQTPEEALTGLRRSIG